MKSEFAQKVYNVVSKIPKGTTMTYAEVAEAAGHPGAFRAVGSLMSHNYDSSIPCHRVIHSDGRTGHYNRGDANKITLLRQEGAIT
jgi:O-6-methylguanine DNA methyltransferase